VSEVLDVDLSLQLGASKLQPHVSQVMLTLLLFQLSTYVNDYSPSVRQQFEDRPDASRLRSAVHAVPLLVFGSFVEYRNETG
jgi:hypothetical protein